MKKNARLNLNLATRPLRNRRLYWLILYSLGLAFLLVSALNGIYFLKYRKRTASLKRSLAGIETSLRNAGQEETALSAMIKELSEKNEKEVSFLNGIILRKSFPWLEIFAKLEKALPSSSYIVSLSPILTDRLTIDFRLSAASPDVRDLLDFMKNLRASGFQKILVLSEVRKEGGALVSEISLSYERPI